MKRLRRAFRMSVGGAICGSFLGIFAGGLLGALGGALLGNVSIGLDGALLGGCLGCLGGALWGTSLAVRSGSEEIEPAAADSNLPAKRAEDYNRPRPMIAQGLPDTPQPETRHIAM